MKTLKEFLSDLQEFVAENPEALEYTVVTSKDDEGNGYNEIYYTPSIGRYEDGDFEQPEDDDEDFTPNAVCLN